MKGRRAARTLKIVGRLSFRVSDELGIGINPELVIRLKGDAVTPIWDIVFAKEVLAETGSQIRCHRVALKPNYQLRIDCRCQVRR